MILTHLNKTPQIDASAYVAPTATICGNVSIAAGVRVMFGACVVAEDAPITIGEDSIVMENAVLRSTEEHSLHIGQNCLIGPNAHVVGCLVGDCVFIATGVSIFHGAKLGFGCEVRVNGVVHLRTALPPHATVPIGWVAVGDPAQIFPPDRHDDIWAVQEPLNFPKFVYGVERPSKGETNMREITHRRSASLGAHKDDKPVGNA
jgi:carbonic anhydrase/acetyltransferase-like protein (isoleucine patch superfamily)